MLASSVFKEISMIERGLRLAELDESEGGWASYFDKNEGLDETDTVKRAVTALMLESARNWLGAAAGTYRDSNTGLMMINEAGRSTVLGGFNDYFFPIIRASVPNNSVMNLVSTQPTLRKTATIGYMDFIYGTTKGSVTAGQTWVSAQNGISTSGSNPVMADYSGEYIDSEVLDTGSGSTDSNIAGTLRFFSGGGVRPGSVRIAATVNGAAVVFVDNAAGGFITVSGTAVISASSINYTTGAVSITISTLYFDDATNATASYRWNSEGGDLPEVDIVPRMTTVETERRGLRSNISAEGSFDFSQEFGMNYTEQVVPGIAGVINYETAVQVLRMMWTAAPSIGSFATTVPSGISRSQHLETLLYQIEYTANTINTNLGGNGTANFAIVDNLAAAHLAVLPDTIFRRTPNITTGMAMGLHKIGVLNGTLDVYKFIHLSRETGASSTYGSMMIGWAGQQFGHSGIVYAPYQAFYSTEPNTTANFVTQQGFASRYALKLINGNAYGKIAFTA